MWIRTMVTLTTMLAFGCASTGMANAHHSKHRLRAYIVQYAGPDVLATNNYGGRLVAHPAHNIACDTIYRSTRPIPCDQPVWVYGSPCEVDLGLGRYRPCD